MGFLRTASSRLQTELQPHCIWAGSSPQQQEQLSSLPRGEQHHPARLQPRLTTPRHFSQPVSAGEATSAPTRGSRGTGSSLQWCKTSTNQCQLPLPHALLSAQPLNHTVFSLAVRQPAADLLVSPSKGEREKEACGK